MYIRVLQRLGRMLTWADLRPCPFNLLSHPYSWFSLFVEMQGQPVNMAEWRSAAAELHIKL
jgi:hypothetical protein